MKKIVKEIPTRTSVSYQCEICKKKYRSEKKAKECEERILEKKIFQIGDEVFNFEPRECYIGAKPYRVKMTIVKILGPKLPDYEYEVKWLGSKRLDMHIFEYEVQYICPRCGCKKDARYYAPEICKFQGKIPSLIKEIRKLLKEQWKKIL